MNTFVLHLFAAYACYHLLIADCRRFRKIDQESRHFALFLSLLPLINLVLICVTSCKLLFEDKNEQR
jgi:hypothetical protein